MASAARSIAYASGGGPVSVSSKILRGVCNVLRREDRWLPVQPVSLLAFGSKLAAVFSDALMPSVAIYVYTLWLELTRRRPKLTNRIQAHMKCLPSTFSAHLHFPKVNKLARSE